MDLLSLEWICFISFLPFNSDLVVYIVSLSLCFAFWPWAHRPKIWMHLVSELSSLFWTHYTYSSSCSNSKPCIYFGLLTFPLLPHQFIFKFRQFFIISFTSVTSFLISLLPFCSSFTVFHRWTPPSSYLCTDTTSIFPKCCFSLISLTPTTSSKTIAYWSIETVYQIYKTLILLFITTLHSFICKIFILCQTSQ